MQKFTTAAENWVNDTIDYKAGKNTMKVYDYTFKVTSRKTMEDLADIVTLNSGEGHEYKAYRFHGEDYWTINGYHARTGKTPFEAMAKIAANEF